MPHEPDGVIDYGATPAQAAVLSGDTNTDALIIGSRWTSFDLTYSFIDDAMDYSIVEDQGIFTGEMSAQQQTAATAWFGMFASVSGLTFTLLDGAEGEQDEDQEAAIRMANGTAGTAFGYYPHSSERGGDIIFGGTGDNPDLGDFDWATVGHEIGHAMGLAHGHTADGLSGIMEAAFNSQEYSIMTYNSYAGHDRVNYDYSTVEPWGSAQTLMMYDIAALQHLYGANYAL